MARAAAIAGNGSLQSSSVSRVDGLVDLIVEVAIEVRGEAAGSVDVVHVGVPEAGGTLGDALIVGGRARGGRGRCRPQQEREDGCELQHGVDA